MSIQVSLQLNKSERIKVDKDLTTIFTADCILLEPTSLIDPVFKLRGSLADLAECNYFTVPAFKRSYFLSNPISLANDYIQFSGHVDVISSWKAGIRSNEAILAKSENHWNLYLNDGSFKVYQNPHVLTKPFPNGFSTYEFVLGIAGS